MTSRFASLTEQDIEKIVEDKDSQNTRSTMVAKELFADYVKEKKLRELEKKREFAQPLKTSETEEGPWGVWKTSDLAWTHFKWTRGINIINDGSSMRLTKFLQLGMSN